MATQLSRRAVPVQQAGQARPLHAEMDQMLERLGTLRAIRTQILDAGFRYHDKMFSADERAQINVTERLTKLTLGTSTGFPFVWHGQPIAGPLTPRYTLEMTSPDQFAEFASALTDFTSAVYTHYFLLEARIATAKDASSILDQELRTGWPDEAVMDKGGTNG